MVLYLYKKVIVDQIILENVEVYAYHGCLDEEAKIGSDYIINLFVDTDLKVPSSSDSLEDTIDYVHLLKIVKEEMSIRSKLLESVAERIISRILNSVPSASGVEVRVSKKNPPINGKVDSVTIVRKGKR